MMQILILGSTGLLGSSLSAYLKRHDYVVCCQSRNPGMDVQCDPGNFNELKRVCDSLRPEAIVNCVAATDVDACERNPALAYQGNVRPAALLASIVPQLSFRPILIHISTDHVYDGYGYNTEDRIQPVNEYAISKLAAEGPILSAGGIVLRTNFFGRSLCPTRKSLTDWLYTSLKNQTPIAVFDNVSISALHIDTVCRCIKRVVEGPIPGLFNVGSTDGTSKADLAYEFAKRLALPTDAMRRSNFMPNADLAKRPLDMRMSSHKFTTCYGFELPTINEQISIAAEEYHDGI